MPDEDPRRERATHFLKTAYEKQMAGEFQEAAQLYRASIQEHPSAEAHTFLGWTYSFLGRYQDAIAECKTAIEVDPDLGNPYNDIGSYLFHLGKLEEAIPWLEKAKQAKRYDPRHFPYLNLARIYLQLGRPSEAAREFEQASFLRKPGKESSETGSDTDLTIH